MRLLLPLFLLITLQVIVNEQSSADLVLVNGKVWTVNQRQPEAEAVVALAAIEAEQPARDQRTEDAVERAARQPGRRHQVGEAHRPRRGAHRVEHHDRLLDQGGAAARLGGIRGRCGRAIAHGIDRLRKL